MQAEASGASEWMTAAGGKAEKPGRCEEAPMAAVHRATSLDWTSRGCGAAVVASLSRTKGAILPSWGAFIGFQ